LWSTFRQVNIPPHDGVAFKLVYVWVCVCARGSRSRVLLRVCMRVRRQHENQPFVCGDVGQLRLFRQGDHAMRLRPGIRRLLLIENSCISYISIICTYKRITAGKCTCIKVQLYEYTEIGFIAFCISYTLRVCYMINDVKLISTLIFFFFLFTRCKWMLHIPTRSVVRWFQVHFDRLPCATY
jgi:hypothetical protein